MRSPSPMPILYRTGSSTGESDPHIHNIQLLKKYLYIHGKYANIQVKRCSILVGVAIFQEGPKNPLKGTSMKSLVSACYAQFWVDAGG